MKKGAFAFLGPILIAGYAFAAPSNNAEGRQSEACTDSSNFIEVALALVQAKAERARCDRVAILTRSLKALDHRYSDPDSGFLDDTSFRSQLLHYELRLKKAFDSSGLSGSSGHQIQLVPSQFSEKGVSQAENPGTPRTLPGFNVIKP